MDYAELETEIVGVLNTYFGANTLADVFEARTMPENKVELLQPFTKGQCNIAYLDSDYATPASTSTIEQMETITLGVFMRCNTVKDEAGSYKLLKAVKNALIGYKPTDARTRMWIADYTGWNIEDAQIGDMLAFKFDTVNVQSIVEPENDVISSTGNTTQGGNFTEVDADLYDAKPEPDVKIGEEQVILADENLPEP